MVNYKQAKPDRLGLGLGFLAHTQPKVMGKLRQRVGVQLLMRQSTVVAGSEPARSTDFANAAGSDNAGRGAYICK